MTSIPTLTSLPAPKPAQDAAQPQGKPLNALKHASPEKIDQVAKEFESMFISQMLENMFSTIDLKDGLGGSEAEETYQSMMVSEYGKVISKAGGLGISDQIKRDMLKLQEVKKG